MLFRSTGEERQAAAVPLRRRRAAYTARATPRAGPLLQCAKRHGAELRALGRLRRAIETQVIERYFECGDPHRGFARIYFDACGHDYQLAYSCQTRYFCPSCHEKRVLAYGERVEAKVLGPVRHRHCASTRAPPAFVQCPGSWRIIATICWRSAAYWNLNWLASHRAARSSNALSVRWWTR